MKTLSQEIKELQVLLEGEKWTSAGGVVIKSVEDPSQVLVIKPSNNYGPWAFPKGQVDKGESQTGAAFREVFEETGVKAQMYPNGKTYLGVFEGSYSMTHYYLMVHTSGNPGPTEETEIAQFVPWAKAISLFQSAGNNRDVQVAMNAQKALDLI